MTVAERLSSRPAPESPSRRGDVLLGEDWVAPDALAEQEFRSNRSRFAMVSLNRSPLARKIMLFNLLALLVLAGALLYLSPFRNGLLTNRYTALLAETQMAAQMLEEPLRASDRARSAGAALSMLKLSPETQAFLYGPDGALWMQTVGPPPQIPPEREEIAVISRFLDGIWGAVSLALSGGAALDGGAPAAEVQAKALANKALAQGFTAAESQSPTGVTLLFTALRLGPSNAPQGVLVMMANARAIDVQVRAEREQILRILVIALLVSVGLSAVLATTIANPLSDLADAAELGRDRDNRKLAPARVRIPDLTARPDEIGRLSVAMRGMVAALYDRIDSNEQFAADVAHEIKNPLASLRSAVGTLRLAKRDDQRAKLLDVIEHDVRRLDRLVSDISNASRLDSELVKEEEEEFNLLKTVANLSEYLSLEAREKGVEFLTDLPSEPITIRGLEGRLAQVFVNLITNAISFCTEGDAVRVWARRRGNRVLVVVEDTGPGIPEQALTKVFKRFYSERPEGQFGNHSGLGLAISKQIVEAHGGVIWAENIRPTEADITSEPLGARFVVGLPV